MAVEAGRCNSIAGRLRRFGSWVLAASSIFWYFSALAFMSAPQKSSSPASSRCIPRPDLPAAVASSRCPGMTSSAPSKGLPVFVRLPAVPTATARLFQRANACHWPSLSDARHPSRKFRTNSVTSCGASSHTRCPASCTICSSACGIRAYSSLPQRGSQKSRSPQMKSVGI